MEIEAGLDEGEKMSRHDSASDSESEEDSDETGFKNRISFKMDRDINLNVAANEDATLIKMKLKFFDYFDWAMIQGSGDHVSTVEKQECEDFCKIGNKENMCCTTITMKARNSKEFYIQYHCMDAAVSNLSSGLWIDEFYYEYECREGSWDDEKTTYKSGASSLAVGAASLLVAASML